MTAEEAKAAVQEYVDGLAAQSVTLSVDGQDVATTAGELGFHWINTDVIDEAVSQYAGGSLIKQYMIEKDLAAAPVEVELETEVDSAKVKNFVDTQCQGITAEPQNASITRENGQFVITDSVPAGWLTWREPRQPLTRPWKADWTTDRGNSPGNRRTAGHYQ